MFWYNLSFAFVVMMMVAHGAVIVAAVTIAWACLCTSLVLYRRPRFIMDLLLNNPSPILCALLGPLVLPSIVMECIFGSCACPRHFNRSSSYNNFYSKRGEENGPGKEAETGHVDLLRLPATQLARLVLDPSSSVTSLSLTKMCIARIERLNHVLNAVVATRYKEAISEAKAADLAATNGTVPSTSKSLWGVPIIVKECFEIENMPFTAGIKGYKGRVGIATAVTMRRVQENGMIIVGTANVSEGCMFHESDNPLYGLTRNPFDLQRTVGGSSGGCGCAIASGMVPIAVTSDVGGSTRIPSFYCGLFGHKPTGGTVPNTGTLPSIAPNEVVSKFCQLGPCARSANDLMPLLKVLAGSDGIDLMVRSPCNLREPSSVRVDESLTVYNFKEPFLSPLLRCGFHPELRHAQKVIIDVLRSKGCIIIDVGHEELPEMRDAFSIWAAMLSMAQHQDNFGEIILSNNVWFLLREILLEAITLGFRREKTHTIPAAGLALLNMVSNTFPSVNTFFKKKGTILIEQMNKLLNKSGTENVIMIVPSLLAPAPRHRENLLRFFSTSQTSIFNVTQHPVTAIPLKHLSRDGLPLGVQIVAGHGMDHVAISVAMALEEAGVAGAPSNK